MLETLRARLAAFHLTGPKILFVSAVVALLVVGHAADSCYQAHKSADIQALAAEIARVDRVQKAAADSVRQAHIEKELADSEAAAARREARGIRRHLASISIALETAKAKATPDTCQPYIAEVQALADSALAAARQGQAAFDSLSEAYDTLSKSHMTLLAAFNEQEAALARLKAASVTVVKHDRPPFLLRILPKPSAGCTAGLDVHGKPNAVCGVSLGWSV